MIQSEISTIRFNSSVKKKTKKLKKLCEKNAYYVILKKKGNKKNKKNKIK